MTPAWIVFCLLFLTGSQGNSLMDNALKEWNKLWLTGTIEMFGYYCDFKRGPVPKFFELQFWAKVRCHGWVPFIGKAEHKNPDRAIDLATFDLIEKIYHNGDLSYKEVTEWYSKLR